VALTFDCDHETRFLRDADESPARLSHGAYGARRGMRRVRALLRRESIPATFFYPAVAAQLHADEVRGVRAEGHEVGFSSWISERRDGLTYQAERDLTFRAHDFIAGQIGRAPAGFRAAHGSFSRHTLAIIRALELRYDSSLMGDDDPYQLLLDGDPTDIIELPSDWALNDATYFDAPRVPPPPSDVLETFAAAFDVAWLDGGLFVLTLHPRLIGHRARIGVLEDLVARIKAAGSVWFASLESVAGWCARQG
jgi:peptidoglycan/xylan/chitin deacetylase (PgdA/CDA1 family)